MYLILVGILVWIVVMRFKKHPRQNKTSVVIIFILHSIVTLAISYVSMTAGFAYVLLISAPSIKSAQYAEKRGGFGAVWLAAFLSAWFSWLGYFAMPKILDIVDSWNSN